MRTIFVLVFVALCGTELARAQVTSSANLACTVVGVGGMACNGIGVPPSSEDNKKSPRMFVTRFTLEPGAALDQPSSSSDCLIVGIDGGDLVNERAPQLHVSLEKDSLTLMPREKPFRLRNKSAKSVEFRLIEIAR
ncbi:MAG: hypothetical protein JOZ10_19605 [Acidobacteria bacterium]|nr:hypothetical protein [Acidobacteriota bacterium]